MASHDAVPTIDLSAYLQDPASPGASTVVDQIRAACSTSGFFQLTGHGIAATLQQQALEAARALFALPPDEKLRLRGPPGRGYERIGSQILESGKQPDLKEGFFIGREIEIEIPDQQDRPPRPFHEPNIWPSTDVLAEARFKTPLLAYHRALTELALVLMRILADGIPHFHDDGRLLADFCKDPIASVRLLHYPPHPDTDDARLVGAGAHTDFGAITLLLQDGHAGLQVLRRRDDDNDNDNDNDNEAWLDVVPRSDAYVVNVGDMLDVWTGGAYKSTVHRVINTSGTERYSIPFFLDGNPDCLIAPLAGAGAAAVAPYTVEEHMLSRYAESYKQIPK